MEPKYLAKKVIVHPNHPLTRRLDPYLKDHPRYRKWLNKHEISKSPIPGATWDPFQMAYLNGL